MRNSIEKYASNKLFLSTRFCGLKDLLLHTNMLCCTLTGSCRQITENSGGGGKTGVVENISCSCLKTIKVQLDLCDSGGTWKGPDPYKTKHTLAIS